METRRGPWLRLFYFAGQSGIGERGKMTKCKGFRTFKERGEWVELVFMAWAARHGFRVSKPWGDSSPYDVGIQWGTRILRVQVKSTDCRTQFGYLCQFKPNCHSQPYTLDQVDFFAAYVIPRDVWYVIPAEVLLRGRGQRALTLLPANPRHPERYKYECYLEAWRLLAPRRGRSGVKASRLRKDCQERTTTRAEARTHRRRLTRC